MQNLSSAGMHLEEQISTLPVQSRLLEGSSPWLPHMPQGHGDPPATTRGSRDRMLQIARQGARGPAWVMSLGMLAKKTASGSPTAP